MKAFYEDRKYKSAAPVDVSLPRDMSFVAHWHKEIEVMYVLEGELGVGINRDFRVLSAGEMSICGKNDIHYYSSEGLHSKTVMTIFDPAMIGVKQLGVDFVTLCSAFLGEIKDAQDRRTVETLFMSCAEELSSKNSMYIPLLKLKLNEIFLLIFRNNPDYRHMCTQKKETVRDEDLKPMQKALKYLEDNYTDEITLDTMSEYAGLSPFYFSRLFKNTTGTNFNTYLKQLRINNAEYLIKTTGGHIIDIAYQAGFKSIRTFNRTFMKIRGYTPQSVRK